MSRIMQLTARGNFRAKVEAVLRALEGHGWEPIVAEALRTEAQQRVKVNAGFSRTMRSKHLPGPDGLARAADIVLKGHGWNAPERFWRMLGSSALGHGLIWGGLFGLNRRMKAALIKSLADKDWDSMAKRGWDPAHLEQP